MHSWIRFETSLLYKEIMQTAKELFVSIKQLNALIALCYHLKTAQLVCHSYQSLCAFVWLSIFSYLKVPSQTFILFLSFVVELQNVFHGRLEKLTLLAQKQKMAKCGSACPIIKHSCRDTGLRFHSPATKNILQSKNRSLKTYHFSK